MTPTDQAIREHMHAAANLLQLVLEQARNEDPAGALHLARAYQAGAMLQLRSTIAASGFACVAVELVEPSGLVHLVSRCELQREVTQ